MCSRLLILQNLCRADCRSEEHTSELQSQSNLVCRLLLENKNAVIEPGADVQRLFIGEEADFGALGDRRALVQLPLHKPCYERGSQPCGVRQSPVSDGLRH